MDTGIDCYQGNSGRSTEYAFYCDHFPLWLDAARATGAGVTPATWGSGLTSLTTSYLPTLVYSTDYRSRADGANTYRAGIYSKNASCKCFVAVTHWRTF